MKYSPREIWDMEAGMCAFDNDELRHFVAETFSVLPREIVEKVLDNCIFIMPLEGEKGCYFPQKDIKDKSIICLSEAHFLNNREDCRSTLLHEVAHFILDHKMGWDISRGEYYEEEGEADAKVMTWQSQVENILI